MIWGCSCCIFVSVTNKNLLKWDFWLFMMVCLIRRPIFWFLLGLFLAGCVATWWFYRPSPVPAQTVFDQAVVFEPVVYDVASFAAQDSTNATPKKLIASLGVALADTGLDYYGRPAQRYRYHSPNEPPFYVMHSEGLLEFGWYFASDKDDETTKSQSLAYAKKAYHAVSPMLGDDAHTVFDQMLNQKQTILPKQVMVATCRHYHCQLVLAI